MGHSPGRLSANPSSVSGGTVGLSIPAPAARTCHGVAPGRSIYSSERIVEAGRSITHLPNLRLTVSIKLNVAWCLFGIAAIIKALS